MPLSEEQFKKLLEKAKSNKKVISDDEFMALISKVKTFKKRTVTKKITDEEFMLLLSKAKTFSLDKDDKVTFKNVTDSSENKIDASGFYEKILEIYGKIMKPGKKPKIKAIIKPEVKQIIPQKVKLSLKDIEGLDIFMKDITSKLDQYYLYSSGGLNVVNHDTTLVGDGTAFSPLGVATVAVSDNYETPIGVIDGVNAIFTVTRIPKSVTLNGLTYFQNDGYTLLGLTITMIIIPVSGSTLRSFY